MLPHVLPIASTCVQYPPSQYQILGPVADPRIPGGPIALARILISECGMRDLPAALFGPDLLGFWGVYVGPLLVHS